MQRVRRNARWGSYAALFALALQFALSFGHVHLDDGELGATVRAEIQKPEEPGTPSGSVPDRDDVCAICTIISLAGSLLIPAAPMLVVGGAQHEAFFPDLIAVLVSDSRRAQFHARAPPV
jgi:hypothetical protein